MAPPDELRHSSSAWLDHHDHHNNNRTASFFNFFFRNKRRRNQPQPKHNSRRTAAAAAAAAAGRRGWRRRGWRRRGWRWRWTLRRQRCGIATMVDKISTEYDITQQQRPRSHRREGGSAGSLAPTSEVARTRHASPATLWCLRINIGLCLPLPSTPHIDQCCMLPCGLLINAELSSCRAVLTVCLKDSGGRDNMSPIPGSDNASVSVWKPLVF